MWNGMKDPSDRKRFLQSFASDKEKALGWMATIEEHCANEEVHARSGKRGCQNASQALALKNLSIRDFKNIEEAMAFAQDRWGENIAEHGAEEEYPVMEDEKKRPLWKQ
eukprot:1865423-Pyramimonas_sp.AAC.1